MKRILSIIGAIGLTATSTTTLIGCEKSEKPNNNEENKPTTPTPVQQPPKDSNWKLVDNKDEEKNRNKIYIGIWENGSNYKIINWKANPAQPKWPLYHFEIVYRWDGVGEPQIPTINPNTGEITDWKEQKGT
ncbi:lipoprotein [Spiroplasma phoeniceum]|uniref:Spiroplasma plectrovirus-related protein n=1 Tax=Spiroplasma phoeniceum P40 TaxID=1276259 RepID=A0A345DQA8_9MOLU|nr:lipoprotein [Spiroplasma phoeniceum]AXF96399.1 spiroplasma plectrovirus-related protein [Spiroplasma phoeniceum P40]